MEKQIYIIMTCNEWKEYSSMHIYAACTSLEKLQTLVAEGIERDYFSYGGEDIDVKEQAKRFREAWSRALDTENPEHELLNLCGNVQYAYVTGVTDGEPQQ